MKPKNTKFYVTDFGPYVTDKTERAHVYCKKHMARSMFASNRLCNPQGYNVTRKHITAEPCELCQLENPTP